MCCHTRAECYLVLLSTGCLLMSLLSAVPMFILSHPGDECLLFVSVRGEALIYGNPAGCNFIAYGHCFAAAGVLLLLLMLFCRRKKGFPIRKPRDTASNRTLNGTQQSAHPVYNHNPFTLTGGLGVVPSASMSTVARRRFARLYSAKVLLLCLLLCMLVWITAFIVVSGYVVSCGELQYETRRQLYGRTTLGVPIKALDIACYSVFRDVDFHSRFHFDHYEYSGQWHGQYRGYQHGRVHQYNTKHRHAIGVATALEMSIAGATIGAILWTILLVMLTYLRVHQKKQQSREVAESIEDARIYASSRDQMEMIGQNKLPMDQSSVTSNQSSSILSQKPDYLMNPNGTISPSSYSKLPSRPATSLGSGPYAQVGGGGPGSVISTNSVQYVQLSNGVIVPITQEQLRQQPQQLGHRQTSEQSVAYAQLQSMQNLAASAAAAAAANGGNRPISTASSSSQQAAMQQQQLLSQQQLELQQLMLQKQQQDAMQQVALQQQQLQMNPQQQQLQLAQQQQQMQLAQQLQQQQQQQQLSPQLSAPFSPIQNVSGTQSQASLPRTSSGVAKAAAPPVAPAGPATDQQDSSNDRMAQRYQINASKDIGMKCSQI